ncbi:MAG: GYD domain-containing protein [candidate division Zixibacteria bacterium]|nr:GYD domain-containing protein [candidate division Zixibacteria bacterium]
MATYIILSSLSATAFDSPNGLKSLATDVRKRLDAECPDVKWVQSYGCMGSYDVVDIVESDDPAQIEKAVMIIRSIGRTTTETLLATPWEDFLKAL